MKKKSKVVFIILLVVGLYFFGVYMFFRDSSSEIEKESLGIEFSGVVKSIYYSEKGNPSAFVNEEFIYIPAANNDQLKVGDSIVKMKGKNIVYHFRKQKLIDSFIGPVIID